MTQTEKLSLEIKRFIKAPRDRVYTAWTDPRANETMVWSRECAS